MLWKFYECKIWIITHIWPTYLIPKAWKANPVASLFARFRYFQKGCRGCMIKSSRLKVLWYIFERLYWSYLHYLLGKWTFFKKSWTHAESPIFMHISFTMKYKRISKKNFKILEKLLFFDSGYYTSLEMDQEHSEDVSNNLSDHETTFFRF